MGMIGNYFRTDDETIKKIKEGEISFFNCLYDEETDEELNEEAMLDIDKAWHMLHYLLAGVDEGPTDNPLSKVVLGGEIFDECEMEYGAWLISKEDVAEACHALKNFSKQSLYEKFSIEDMIKKDIYPVQPEHGKEEMVEYISHYFDDIVDFFNKAKEENEHIIFFIN